MTKTDTFQLNDIWIALSLLTRLPAPKPDWQDDTPAARAARAYPVAGFAVAGLAGLVAHGLLWAGLDASLVAGLVLALMAMATGAMHEDGLADCADGIWGGWDKNRRLKIMKDSNIGTYGVIALVLSFGLRWMALSFLFEAGWVLAPLLASAVASRSAMTWVMHLLPHARDDGLAVQTGRPHAPAVYASTLISVVLCLMLTGMGTLLILAAAGFATGFVAGVARRKIDGQTGDVLGATQQVNDMLILCALTLML